MPPNPAGPGIVGTIIAITMKGKGMSLEAALALSFPFAVIIQLFITGIYTVSTGFAARAEQEVEKGNYRRFRLLANGTLLMFVAMGFILGFGAAFQVKGLERLVGAIPQWLTEGLGTAGKILPAVGFAVILSAMARWDTIPFLALGYVMAAYLKLPVLAVALASAALSWIAYGKRPIAEGPEKGGEEDGNWGEGQRGKPDDKSRVDESFGAESFGRERLGGPRIPEPELRRLSKKTALRAYFLQNGYNYGNYEGLSYANIMFPAFCRICANEAQLRRELKDSMGYCSVNPNFLPILTSIHLAALNRGIPGRGTRDIRLALMGPLAGVGDSLVQFCLAPVFSTIGAAMAQEGLILGPVVFLLGMNGLLLAMKLSSEKVGYRLGASLAERLKGSMDPLSGAARMVGAAVIAGLAANCVDLRLDLALAGVQGEVLEVQGFLDMLLPGALPVAYMGILFYLIRKRKWGTHSLVAMTLVLGVLLKTAGILL